MGIFYFLKLKKKSVCRKIDLRAKRIFFVQKGFKIHVVISKILTFHVLWEEPSDYED